MGIFSKKPRPGNEVVVTRAAGRHREAHMYRGVMVNDESFAYVLSGTVEEMKLQYLQWEDYKATVVPDGTIEQSIGRRDMRKVIRHMGVTPAEEMLGSASEKELDRRWELMQNGDAESAARAIGEAAAKNAQGRQ